jgi:hypothetical protein
VLSGYPCWLPIRLPLLLPLPLPLPFICLGGAGFGALVWGERGLPGLLFDVLHMCPLGACQGAAGPRFVLCFANRMSHSACLATVAIFTVVQGCGGTGRPGGRPGGGGKGERGLPGLEFLKVGIGFPFPWVWGVIQGT